jgi:hypothetical protein
MAGECTAVEYTAGECTAGEYTAVGYMAGECTAVEYTAGECTAGEYTAVGYMAGECTAVEYTAVEYTKVSIRPYASALPPLSLTNLYLIFLAPCTDSRMLALSQTFLRAPNAAAHRPAAAAVLPRDPYRLLRGSTASLPQAAVLPCGPHRFSAARARGPHWHGSAVGSIAHGRA